VRVVAAILAAGQGTRFGGDKTASLLGGRPVWRWSFETYAAHPEVDEVIVVTAPDRVAGFSGCRVIEGGSTRQQSSRLALAGAWDADVLLLQDAARPFVTPAMISGVIAAVHEAGAAAVGVPVTDTIKQIVDGRLVTVPRETLFAMQTPQGATTSILRAAHEAATADLTDEMALVEAIGVHPRIVPGDPNNFKITTPQDLERARCLVGQESRTGLGYDVHAFCDDPTQTLWLGGIEFPGHRPLLGHSDADVLLHAATDALLGAAALGDIGQHFPNNDPRWRGEPSLTFVRHAAQLLAEQGWQIVNLDMTMIAESPKVMPQAVRIRETVAAALEISVDRVSVKATTNEKLGTIGRGEGIAAFATATIRR